MLSIDSGVWKWAVLAGFGVFALSSGVALGATVASGGTDDDDDDNDNDSGPAKWLLYPNPWNSRNRIGIGVDYGYTRMPSGNGHRFHRGIDMHAPHGNPCVCSAKGDVVFAGFKDENYGNTVIVEHKHGGEKYFTVYAHLQSIAVEVDEEVKEGEKLGAIGSSGNTVNGNSPHIHYEVRKGKNERGSSVDPIPLFKNPPSPVFYSKAIRRER